MELSKEEQEAIEKFREYIDYCENNKECREELKQCFGCTVEVEEINAMQIILNLISKLQKENELLKEQKEYVINEYGETIEKQSKVINEMADLISCECEDDWIVELYNIADGNINELVKEHFYGNTRRFR